MASVERITPEGLVGEKKLEVGAWYKTKSGRIHRVDSWSPMAPYRGCKGIVMCSDGRNRIGEGAWIGGSTWGTEVESHCFVFRCNEDGSPYSSPSAIQLELF